jgi:hypothetical protein
LPIPVVVDTPVSTYNDTESSHRRSRTSGLTQTTENLHVHPPIESLESPTDNIPMSPCSEVQFRQRLSADNITHRSTDSSLLFASSFDSHPTLRSQDFTPRPFDPAILVSRVLGLQSPAAATARLTGYSSSSVSSPSPHASAYALIPRAYTPSPGPYGRSPALRHDTTNTHGDRSIPEHSRSNSLGPKSSFSQ